MSRLKDLLRVARPSPSNAQQPLTRTVSDASGCVSQESLHVASTNPRNTQHNSLHGCLPVAQRTQPAQQVRDWQEFESLLAIVGPAYNTPAHEYELICEVARQDLPAALEAYRGMARQIEAN